LSAELLEDRTLPSVRFGEPVGLPVRLPGQVVTADFNHDGLTDMVAVTPQDITGTPGGLTVFMNDPLHPGQFVAKFTYEVNAPADAAVVVGQFHQNSPNLDIAFLDSFGNTVSMLRGHGDGTFSSEGSYTATPGATGFGATNFPDDLVAGDFNGDGKLDIAVSRQWDAEQSGGIYVLRGNGDGTFQDPTLGYGNFELMNPTGMVTADFDGDGNLDVAFLDSGFDTRLVILHGNGDGTFERIYVENDALQSSATWYPVPGFPRAAPDPLVVGDFDQDGRPDLAAATGQGVSVVLGNPAYSYRTWFYPTPSFTPTAITVGDFNGDGKTDLALANGVDGVDVLQGINSLPPGTVLPDHLFIGPFVAARPPDGQFPSEVASLAVGHFDSDHAPDLACTNVGGLATVLNQPPVTRLLVESVTGHDTAAPGNFPAIVQAFSNFGDVVTNYTGTVHLVSSDPEAILPPDYQFQPSDSGTHAFSVRLSTPGTQYVNAVDTVSALYENLPVTSLFADPYPIIRSDSDPFTVLPPLTIAGPSNVVAGTPFSLTVRVMDASGTRPDPSYRGTITFTSTDPTATLPAPYTFTAADQGIHTFDGVQLYKVLRPGLLPTIFATDTAQQLPDGFKFLTGSKAIAVQAGVATRLRLIAPPAVAAGDPYTVTVQMLDDSGNVATGYVGTVTFASSSPGATLPLPYTFTSADQGVHTFTLRTTGAITATGTGTTAALTQTATVMARYLVTNTADGGPGSLRQAILDANANPGPDLIGFAIPGPGVHTISPASPLPDVTDPVTIDGYTQPGARANTQTVSDNAVLLVQLDGSGAGSGAGLHITAGNSTVRGLDVTGFGYAPGFVGTGILVESNGGNVIEGNFFGVDPTGMIAQNNGHSSVDLGSSNNTLGGSTPAARNIISGYAEFGVYIGGDHNVVSGNYIGLKADNSGTLGSLYGLGDYGTNTRIGGTTPGERNIISGSQYHGVALGGTAAVLEGNYIGTDATGTVAFPNGMYGVASAGKHSTIGGLTATPGTGAGNVISGNQTGIDSTDEFTTIEGNVIGLNAAGTAALSNTLVGIALQSATYGVTIGGGVPGSRNVISGNGGDGIWIQYVVNQFAQPIGGVVQGNSIGTDLAGTSAIGNAGNGITLDGTRNVTVGGAAAGAGNLIGGNAHAGVLITGSAAAGNVIEGNVIGRVTGGAAPGNAGDGVRIALGAHDNRIGDPVTGEPGALGNTIAFNGGAGVALRDAATVNNSILGNAIFGNVGKGIDVAGSGVTLQPPTLLAAASDPDSTVVSGTLAAQPGGTYVIEFTYAAVQQVRVVARRSVTTDGTGRASFAFPLPPMAAGEMARATATDAAGNTSEFSNLVAIPPAVLLIDPTGAATYTAGAGAANRLTISQSGGSYTFKDAGELIVAVSYDPVVVCSGSGTQTVTCSQGITSIRVDVGDRQDTVNVQSISVPTIIDDTGGGDDTVNVGAPIHPIFDLGSTVQGITATLSVRNATGHTTLNVNDSGDIDPTVILASISSNAVSDLAPAVISFQQGVLAALNIWLGINPNRVTVSNTPDNTLHPVTTLTVGTGTAVVTVQNTAGRLRIAGSHGTVVDLGGDGFTPGTVQGVRGDVTITSPDAVVAVDDRKDSNSRQVTISAGAITGLAPATIAYPEASLRQLLVSGGSADNTFTVTGTPAAPVTLTTGGGADTVNVQATTGPLSVVGAGANSPLNADTINVGNAGNVGGIHGTLTLSTTGGFIENLSVDDSADPTGRSPVIDANSIIGLAPAAIDFAAAVLGSLHLNHQVLTVQGGFGGNTFTVAGVRPNVNTTLRSGAGDDTVILQVSEGKLTLDGQGGTNRLVAANTMNTWDITGADAGSLVRVPTVADHGSPHTAITFASFQHLVGGTTADTFSFQNGGSISGSIDGGGGFDWLRYDGYRGDVTVNLLLHLASLVNQGAPGGVSRIANVMGSMGDDLIVGDANANELIGVTGRNVIIGGAGADNLTVGGGDNILIAGTTSYDQNLAALGTIFQEWTRRDAPQRVRRQHLQSGGGLNGSYVLNAVNTESQPATVFDDGAADVLFADPQQNWYFMGPDDRITF
jgi:hypothetical protein